MTIAEQLIQRGREESAEALRQAQLAKEQAILKAQQAAKEHAQRQIKAEKQQIALNLLKSGLDIEFVAKNTQIDIASVKQLLEDTNKH